MDKFKNNNCLICDGSNFQFLDFNGVDCIYTRKISKQKRFKFKICKNCSYTINLKYQKLDFAEMDYDNFTTALEADKREIIYSKFIINFILEKTSVLERINFIEIGSGFRLGLLNELSKTFQNSNFFAIDPIFKNIKANKFKSNSLKTLKSVDEINLDKKSWTVLLLRNSLEYIYPSGFRSLLKKVFYNGGLFWTEFTQIAYEKMGSSFFYSECNNFYSKKSIKLLFDKSNFNMTPIFETFLYGDYRDLIFAEIKPKMQSENIYEFENLYDLVNHCLNNKNKHYVMWGLGGRNMMTLLNELRNIVFKVVDSDPKRIGIDIPYIGKVKDTLSLTKEESIICLNNRFINEIRKIYSANKILIIRN